MVTGRRACNGSYQSAAMPANPGHQSAVSASQPVPAINSQSAAMSATSSECQQSIVSASPAVSQQQCQQSVPATSCQGQQPVVSNQQSEPSSATYSDWEPKGQVIRQSGFGPMQAVERFCIALTLVGGGIPSPHPTLTAAHPALTATLPSTHYSSHLLCTSHLLCVHSHLLCVQSHSPKFPHRSRVVLGWQHRFMIRPHNLASQV